MRKFLFALANVLLWPVIRLVFFARSAGNKNVPKKGAVIIASNHINALDPFFISTFLPRNIRCLAKAELFRKPVFGSMMRAVGMVPVERTSVKRESIDGALEVLASGEALCIFPQGTRRKGVDPTGTPIKSGVGMFAYHAKAPVIPVFIEAKGMKARPFHKTVVHFGEPIPYEELGFESGSIGEFRNASQYIFTKICALGGYRCKEENLDNNG